MFLQLLIQSILKRKRAFSLATLSVALGVSVGIFLFSLATLTISQLGKELKAYGANFLITAKSWGSTGLTHWDDPRLLIAESSLRSIKQSFWKNQFMAISPVLLTPVRVNQDKMLLIGTHFNKTILVDEKESFTSGLKTLHPHWQVTGKWPEDGTERKILVGKKLAKRFQLAPGSRLVLHHQNRPVSTMVTGILTTGTEEEWQLFAPLPFVQNLTQKPNKIHQIHASVLIHPPDTLSLKEPSRMSPTEYDRWYCTPYPNSIAAQLSKTLPGLSAQPIEQMIQAEGSFLSKISLLLWFLAGAALITGGLGMMSTLTSMVLERRMEIGLMKALGASHGHLLSVFLTEISLIGWIGGSIGCAVGFWLAQKVDILLFHTSLRFEPTLLLLSLGLAWFVALISGIWPLQRALRFDPMVVLKEGSLGY